MTFEAWLRKQKNRDDAIGDLSKDFISDAKLRYRRDGVKIKLTKEYLLHARACDDAIRAYKEAKKEYKYAMEAATETMDADEPQEKS